MPTTCTDLSTSEKYSTPAGPADCPGTGDAAAVVSRDSRQRVRNPPPRENAADTAPGTPWDGTFQGLDDGDERPVGHTGGRSWAKAQTWRALDVAFKPLRERYRKEVPHGSAVHGL